MERDTGELKDFPILFSKPMVRALLDGRKTQTRRLAHERPRVAIQVGDSPVETVTVQSRWCLLQPGDRLWVREAVRADTHLERDQDGVRYLADDAWHPLGRSEREVLNHFRLRSYRSTDPDLDACKPVPTIHMPRWASRLTLVVEEVRRERLQDICEQDAVREGLINNGDRTWPLWTAGEGFPDRVEFPRDAFRDLWESINGPGSWDTNPEVVAITFRVERRNVDLHTALSAAPGPSG